MRNLLIVVNILLHEIKKKREQCRGLSVGLQRVLESNKYENGMEGVLGY